MHTMYKIKVKSNIRNGMLCASCDAVGHTLKVTRVCELFGNYYVEAQSTLNHHLYIEGRDKDFVYKATSPDLYARIVSGNFDPATGQ